MSPAATIKPIRLTMPKKNGSGSIWIIRSVAGSICHSLLEKKRVWKVYQALVKFTATMVVKTRKVAIKTKVARPTLLSPSLTPNPFAKPQNPAKAMTAAAAESLRIR